MDQSAEKAATFVNSINFQDPDSIKAALLTMVRETQTLRHENDELKRQLTQSQPPSASSDRPRPNLPAPPTGSTRPFKGDKFSGEKGSVDIDEFLRKVKLQIQIDNTPSDMRSLVLISGLTGRAYQEVSAYEAAGNSVLYTQLCDFLRDRFTDTAKSDNAYRQIHTMKQYGSIREFNKIFSKHVLDISPRPAENLLVAAYTNAVTLDLAKEIWAQKPKKLSDAMILTEGFEDLIRAHSRQAKAPP